MKSTLSLMTLLLTTATAVAPIAVYAESSPEVNANVADSFTQGEAALILAKKMGLFFGSSVAATEQGAIKLLNQAGILPPGGWDAGSELVVGDAAVILVKALGIEKDLPKGKKNDAAANLQLIKDKYGHDLSDVKAVFDDVKANPKSNNANNIPVSLQTPVSQEDLEAALVILVPVSAGSTSGGQVSSGNSNDTGVTP